MAVESEVTHWLPVHPSMLPGESLSSWLVRTAHANGLKVETFCHHLFGLQRPVWNRDIDRLGPEWLIATMAKVTPMTVEQIRRGTLALYEGKLFKQIRHSGINPGVLPLLTYHRRYRGHGIQYCPLCLQQDERPYFRLAWRIAYYTFCPHHMVMLRDECHVCGAGVAFHRIEQGRPERRDVETLAECWNCGADLRQAPIEPITPWIRGSFERWRKLLLNIENGFHNGGAVDYYAFALVRQLCRIMLGNRRLPSFYFYICQRTGQQPWPREQFSPHVLEMNSIAVRHHLISMAWWLLGRGKSKLAHALAIGELHRSQLTRDLRYSPVEPPRRVRYLLEGSQK